MFEIEDITDGTPYTEYSVMRGTVEQYTAAVLETGDIVVTDEDGETVGGSKYKEIVDAIKKHEKVDK